MNLTKEKALGREEPYSQKQSHFAVVHNLEDVLVALSLANLCLVCSWFTILYDADHGYFNKIRVESSSLLALLANISWIAVLGWLVLRFRRRHHRLVIDLACGLLFWVFLLVPLEFFRVYVMHIPAMRFLAILRGPIGITCMVAFVSMLVWKPKVVAAAPLVLVGIFSPLAVFNLIRIGLLLVGLTHLDQHRGGRTLPAAQPGPEGQARVIWMIFDETDQRLAFEKRPATVHLPEFDRLREESIFATNAYSPGDSTLLSMPALILGRPFSAASPSSASDLALSVPNTNLTNSWQEQPSVFDGARKLGVNTALVGWYHPYDRVLQRGLNYCAWFPIPNFEPARAATLGGSLTRELGAMTGGFYIRYLYVGLCQESFKEAVSVIANRSYGLVLLHLPLPHEPGIYQPDKDRFTAWGMPRTTGYFNNLILADRWLGKLRRSLETSTPPTNTWLIVSSDHSWRESRLYDQIRDLRVPFIIRPPGAPKAQTYSSHLNTVVTHDLILAILRNEIQSRQDTLAWLDQHRSVLPAPAESQGDL